MVAIFEVTLLFEFAEQGIAALGRRGRREQSGIPIVDSVCLDRLFVEFKLQTVLGQAAAAFGRG
jgi:hypothetical protein